MAGALCAKSPSLNTSWPSLASLQADPWAAYLTAVYRDLGALPFPFSLTSLSFFYQDLLPAGVRPRAITDRQAARAWAKGLDLRRCVFRTQSIRTRHLP